MRFIRNLTLQEICLQVVIENLDKFIYNKINIPQRQIDFLLRVYSKECFRQYTKSHRQSEECLLWFLSHHNKNVYLPNVTKDIMKKLQIAGSNITSLTLKEALMSENMLNGIISLIPNVSYLDLTYTSCSDQTLLCIGRMCPYLVTLNLEYCNVTNDGMYHLCSNNLSLKNLNIYETDINSDGLYGILKGMPSLQNLHYYNLADALHAIHEPKQFSIEHTKYNLSTLIYCEKDLCVNPLEVIWTCILLCPKVEELHIFFYVSQDVLQLCTKFSNLKILDYRPNHMWVNKYADKLLNAVGSFLPLVNLTTLILHKVEIPSEALINCLKKVRDLSLFKTSFTHFKEEDIKLKCTNLNTLKLFSLNMKETIIYKFVILLISLSKNVTKLCINHIACLPEELVNTILDSMKRLSFVELSYIGSKLPSSCCKFFAIPSMKQVNFDGDFYSNYWPANVAAEHNTLSWQLMSDDSDDEEDDSTD